MGGRWGDHLPWRPVTGHNARGQPQPSAGRGRSEGALAAAAPYIAGGVAPLAPSNRCRSRAGCPPARGGGAAASPCQPSLRTHSPSDGGARSALVPRTAPPASLPPLPPQSSGGARSRPPPASSRLFRPAPSLPRSVPTVPRGWAMAVLPEPAGHAEGTASPPRPTPALQEPIGARSWTCEKGQERAGWCGPEMQLWGERGCALQRVPVPALCLNFKHSWAQTFLYLSFFFSFFWSFWSLSLFFPFPPVCLEAHIRD